MTVWGIDISNHQAGADLSKAKAAGCSFVFVKATEGLTYDDDHFAGFRQQAKALGLPFAAYHFARPQAGRTGSQEAAHFLRVYRRAPGDLPPILDLESNGVESPPGSGHWVNRLSKAALTQFTQDFLAAVEKGAGVRPMIYTGSWFWTDQVTPLSVFARYPLWLANYRPTPPPAPRPWSSWLVWQHTSSATVPGIPGRCDRNIAAPTFLTTITPQEDDDMTPDEARDAVLKADIIPSPAATGAGNVTPVTALKWAMEWSLAGRNAAQEALAIAKAQAAKGGPLTAAEIEDAMKDALAGGIQINVTATTKED